MNEAENNVMRKIIYIIPLLLILISLASCAVPSDIVSAAPATVTASGQQEVTNTPAAEASAEPTTEATPAETAPISTPIAPVSLNLEIKDAYPALSFARPLYFAVPGDGSNNCFVLEQAGRIKIFDNRPDVAEASVFLDLSGVVDSNGNEKGLLGLAFDPDYKNNGYLYVNYTNKDSTVIARYTRRPESPKEADPASEEIILTFAQPYPNHNGGQLAFGSDGFLYIGTGDGGSSGDPQKNAQNRSSLLGKILRIDVNHTENGSTYSIPADNPYAGNTKGYREEIYALGLRNPWRFSFDGKGALWLGDVGQNAYEEVDIVEKGGNYGWNVMEGLHGYKKNNSIDKAELIPPVWEYAHGKSQCITGGYVYDSAAIIELKGRYIYGDYVSGKIWALWIDESNKAVNQELLDTNLNISSFGIDNDGDILIVDLSGKLYRLQISQA